MVTTMLTKKCEECGSDFTLDPPAHLSPKWAAKMLDMVKLCEECGDAEEEREARLERDREVERRIQFYENRLEASGLPASLQRLRFDDLERDSRAEAIKSAEAWARGEFPGLILSGQVGVGKTRIAATAANRMLMDRSVDWVKTGRLIIQAKAKLGGDEHGEMQRIMLNNGALILDDIDKVNPTGFALEILFEAIDSRMTDEQPLLITTNLHYEEFAETFKDSIASRVRGYCKGFGMVGDDRRLTNE